MNIKKIYIIVIIFTIILPIKSFSYDYLESNKNENIILTSTILNQTPKLNARHCVVLDRNSKTILFGKDENEKSKMASTTKIMTSLIVIENCKDLNQTITVSKKAAGTGGSRLGLKTNDKITIQNLLYGLMMVSGNDAAVALAEAISGSIEDFAILMNRKAESLGLTSTHFVTPHGLDEDEHYTTAYELAILTDYALSNEIFLNIVRTQNYTININGYPKSLNNTNELLGYLDGIYGVKTGFTNGANRCLVTACKRGDLDIICVVLGADTKKDRTTDSINLITYTFNNFTLVNLKEIINKDFENWKLNNSNSIIINKGLSSNLNLFLDISQIPYEQKAINRLSIDKISTNVTFTKYFDAPVKSNTLIGEIDVCIDNNNLFSIPILNNNLIKRKNSFFYLKDFTKNYFNYLISRP